MKQAKYILTDENGIHARPAGVIVQTAKRAQSTVTLTLGGHTGDTLVIEAVGTDEDNAVENLLAELVRIGL